MLNKTTLNTSMLVRKLSRSEQKDFTCLQRKETTHAIAQLLLLLFLIPPRELDATMSRSYLTRTTVGSSPHAPHPLNYLTLYFAPAKLVLLVVAPGGALSPFLGVAASLRRENHGRLLNLRRTRL